MILRIHRLRRVLHHSTTTIRPKSQGPKDLCFSLLQMTTGARASALSASKQYEMDWPKTAGMPLHCSSTQQAADLWNLSQMSNHCYGFDANLFVLLGRATEVLPPLEQQQTTKSSSALAPEPFIRPEPASVHGVVVESFFAVGTCIYRMPRGRPS